MDLEEVSHWIYCYRISEFTTSPLHAATPLCANIEKVVESIRKHEATLRASNQKACVIIATDGESSDGEIIKAMKPLETLPCCVVIRLYTKDEK
jgi:hypothetical protein